MNSLKSKMMFLLVLFFAPSLVSAYEFRVRDCSNDVQLRGAISIVNRNTNRSLNDNLIILPNDCHIRLSGDANEDSNRSGDLDIMGNVTIRGESSYTRSSISGANLDRIFHIQKAADLSEGPRVKIENLLLQDGRVEGAGGAIMVGPFSELNLVNSRLQSNVAFGEREVIRNEPSNYRGSPTTIVWRALVPTGEGGAIFVAKSAKASLENSALNHNTANACGGALCNYGGAILNRVVIDHNQVNLYGGGIGNGQLRYHVPSSGRNVIARIDYDGNMEVEGSAASAPLVLINVTIYGNSVLGNGSGAAIANVENSAAYINQTSIINNSSAYQGGGISNGFFSEGLLLLGNPETFFLKNSVVSNNTINLSSPTRNNCSGAFHSEGYNVSDDTSCSLREGVDQVQSSINLMTFGDYSAPYPNLASIPWTLPLHSASPVLNLIPNTSCFAKTPEGLIPVTTDARGIPRPQGGACDPGSHEGEAVLRVLPEPWVLYFGRYDSMAAGATLPLPQNITLQNNGTIPMQVRSYSVPIHYRISRNTCVREDGPISLAPLGGSCQIEISFNPGTDYGVFNERLNIVTTALNTNMTLSPSDRLGLSGQFSVFLSGENVAPPSPPVLGENLTLSPSAVMNFSTPQGTTASQTLRMTNSGDPTVINYSIGGEAASQFSISSAEACRSGMTLNNLETCEIIVRFSPSSLGTFNAQVNISSIAGLFGSVQNVNLSGNSSALSSPPLTSCGNSICEMGELLSCSSDCGALTLPTGLPRLRAGAAPESRLEWSTPGLSFSPTAVGSSTELPIDLINRGSVAAQIDAISVSFGNTDYSTRLESCNVGMSLAPAATCRVVVKFSPSSAGSTLNGSLNVTYNSGSLNNTAILSGSSMPATSGGSLGVMIVSPNTPRTSSSVTFTSNSSALAICRYYLDTVLVNEEGSESLTHNFTLNSLINGSHTMLIQCSGGGLSGQASYVWNVLSAALTGPGPEIGSREVTSHEIATDSIVPEGKKGCSLVMNAQPLKDNQFEYASYLILFGFFFSLRLRKLGQV